MDNVIQFFGEYKQFFVIAHIFTVIVGMGTAIVSDILFSVYIKDKKINPTENTTLQVLSRVIWISLGLIVLSGLAIFLSDPLKYIDSTKFLLKMFIVLVIILNGYLFWKITHASLKKIDFTDTNNRHKHVRIRKLSFAFGAVSIVSWLSAFVLASLDSMPVSFNVALGLYALVLVIGVMGSQIVEYGVTHRK